MSKHCLTFWSFALTACQSGAGYCIDPSCPSSPLTDKGSSCISDLCSGGGPPIIIVPGGRSLISLAAFCVATNTPPLGRLASRMKVTPAMLVSGNRFDTPLVGSRPLEVDSNDVCGPDGCLARSHKKGMASSCYYELRRGTRGDKKD